MNKASLEVLGYPAVLITYGGERHRVSLKLRGISPPEPKKPTRTLSVSNKKPQEPKPVPVSRKPPPLVARTLF